MRRIIMGKSKKWLVGCLTLAVMVGALTGCGTENNSKTPPKSTVAITDIAGTNVEVPKEVKKIAVVPLPWASVVYALDGGSSRLGAIHPGAMSAYKGCFLEKMDAEYGKINTKNVNQDFTVNAEALAADGIDAAIMWKHQEKDAQKLTQMGIPTVRIINDNVENLKKSFLIVGKLLGKEERAKQVNAYYDEAYNGIKKFKDQVEKADKTKVLFLRNKKLKLQGNDNFIKEAIEIGGGNAIVTGTGEGNSANGNITMEEIYKEDPDIILLSNFDSFVPEDIYQNKIPGQDWSAVKAVKNKRVYKVPMGIYRWDAPGVETPLMMKWLAHLLQPGIFKDIDIHKETRSFFKDFMKYDLTDSDLAIIFADEANKESVPVN